MSGRTFDFGVGIEIPDPSFAGRAADFHRGYSIAIGILRHWSENHLSEEANKMLRLTAKDLEATQDVVIAAIAAQLEIQSEGNA